MVHLSDDIHITGLYVCWLRLNVSILRSMVITFLRFCNYLVLCCYSSLTICYFTLLQLLQLFVNLYCYSFHNYLLIYIIATFIVICYFVLLQFFCNYSLFYIVVGLFSKYLSFKILIQINYLYILKLKNKKLKN